MASKLAPFRDRGENSSSPSCDVLCLGVQCGVNASFNSPANESQSHQDSLRAGPWSPGRSRAPASALLAGARSMRTADTVVLGVGSTNVAPRRTESCWNVTGSFPAKPREGSAYSSVTGPLSAWPEPGPLRLSKATVTIHRRHAGGVWSQRCMGLPRIRGAVSRRTSAPAHGAPARCSLVGVMPGYATSKLAARDCEYTVERILAWTSKHRRTVRYLGHLSCNPRTCGP